MNKKYKYSELTKEAQDKAVSDYLQGWTETHEDEDFNSDECHELLLDESEEMFYDEDGHLLDEEDLS